MTPIEITFAIILGFVLIALFLVLRNNRMEEKTQTSSSVIKIKPRRGFETSSGLNDTMAQFTDIDELRKHLAAGKREFAKRDKAILDEKGNLLFTFETPFRWGMHKGNELRDVFKIHPGYIEWCIFNVNCFAIAPNLLKMLVSKSSFRFSDDQLKQYIENTNDEALTLNLLNFQRSSDGFLHKEGIEDYFYLFSEQIFNINERKIDNGIDFNAYQLGIPTGDSQKPPFMNQYKGKRIKFKVPS